MINNLAYNLFYDCNQILSIQSKRAEALLGQSELLLYGRVIIFTSEGYSLEANRISWDLEKQLFNINLDAFEAHRDILFTR